MQLYISSRISVSGMESEKFAVNVGIHQGSGLSFLFCIIVLEALSIDFRTGMPWKLLYADGLIIIAVGLENAKEKFRMWRECLESRGLRVKLSKMEMISKCRQCASDKKWSLAIFSMQEGCV